jgi:hypothetical protein
VFSFTFPYGSCNDRVAEAAGKNYPLVFGPHNGLNNMSLERNRLRRTQIMDSDLLTDLWFRAHFGWSLAESIAVRLGRSRNRVRPMGSDCGSTL